MKATGFHLSGNTLLFLTFLKVCGWPEHTSAASASPRSVTNKQVAMLPSSGVHSDPYDAKLAHSSKCCERPSRRKQNQALGLNFAGISYTKERIITIGQRWRSRLNFPNFTYSTHYIASAVSHGVCRGEGRISAPRHAAAPTNTIYAIKPCDAAASPAPTASAVWDGAAACTTAAHVRTARAPATDSAVALGRRAVRGWAATGGNTATASCVGDAAVFP